MSWINSRVEGYRPYRTDEMVWEEYDLEKKKQQEIQR